MNTPGCISRLNLSISIYSSVLVEEMDNVLVRALRCISRLSHTHWEGKPPFTGLFRTYHINFLSNSHQCQTHIKNMFDIFCLLHDYKLPVFYGRHWCQEKPFGCSFHCFCLTIVTSSEGPNFMNISNCTGLSKMTIFQLCWTETHS